MNLTSMNSPRFRLLRRTTVSVCHLSPQSGGIQSTENRDIDLAFAPMDILYCCDLESRYRIRLSELSRSFWITVPSSGLWVSQVSKMYGIIGQLRGA